MNLVATTERTINDAISGAFTAENEDVYAIIMHGHFTDFGVVPPGHQNGPHPTGTELVVVWGAVGSGAYELELTDFFIGNQNTNVAKLGLTRRLAVPVPK